MSQFTTYHLPLAEENDCREWFLQSAYLKIYLELTARKFKAENLFDRSF